jgi:hypothetical protein
MVPGMRRDVAERERIPTNRAVREAATRFVAQSALVDLFEWQGHRAAAAEARRTLDATLAAFSNVRRQRDRR